MRPGPSAICKLRPALVRLTQRFRFRVWNAETATFIRAVSAARPKVADYPFTTLQPNLGVVRTSEARSFVIADIPGLIEGAAEGAGLGHQFLRHLQRTSLLLHLVDLAPFDPEADPVRDAHAIAEELRKYDPGLYEKPRWLVLNKLDLIAEEDRAGRIQHFLDAYGPVERHFEISAINGDGCRALIFALQDFVDAQRERREAERLATLARMEPDVAPDTAFPEPDGSDARGSEDTPVDRAD